MRKVLSPISDTTITAKSEGISLVLTGRIRVRYLSLCRARRGRGSLGIRASRAERESCDSGRFLLIRGRGSGANSLRVSSELGDVESGN